MELNLIILRLLVKVHEYHLRHIAQNSPLHVQQFVRYYRYYDGLCRLPKTRRTSRRIDRSVEAETLGNCVMMLEITH